MKFSSEIVNSVASLKGIKEFAVEAKKKFAASAHDNSLDNDEVGERHQQSLVWNNEICSPTFSADEAIIHCRVRQSDDIVFSQNASIPSIESGGS